MRIGEKLVDVVDRRGGHFGSGEDRHVFVERARGDKFGDRGLASAACRTLSVLVRKRGSEIMSYGDRRKRRSAMAWIEAEIPI